MLASACAAAQGWHLLQTCTPVKLGCLQNVIRVVKGVLNIQGIKSERRQCLKNLIHRVM